MAVAKSRLLLSTLLLVSTLISLAAFAKPGDLPSFAGIANRNFVVLDRAQCEAQYVDLESRASERLALARAALSNESQMPSLIEAFTAWTPSGAPSLAPPASCEPEVLENGLLKARGSSQSQAAFLASFYKRCDRPLTGKGSSPLLALTKLGGVQYELCQNPSIRKVAIRLPSGIILRAYLGLKAGQTPRPLVIVKCGALCNAGDPSHRFMIMHLFDESPFHVLAIGNGSGADFVRDNGYIGMGGFTEGQQLIELAHSLRSGDLGKRISSLHFVGVSLGAHAGLFANYFAESTAFADGRRPFDSTLAFCPVVDLEDSMKDLFQDSTIQGYIAKKFFLAEVTKAIRSMPILGSLLPQGDDLPASKIPSIVAEAAARHYASSSTERWLAPARSADLSTSEGFWRWNQFSKLAHRPLHTPTLVVTATNDDVVRPEVNTFRLRDALSQTAGSEIGIATSRNGSHCAQSVIHGWGVTSAIYRNYVVSHSPEMLARRRDRTVTIPESFFTWRKLPLARESLYQVVYEIEPGKAKLDVYLRIFSSRQLDRNDNCSIGTPIDSPKGCIRRTHIEIPFEQIQGAAEWMYVPRTKAEAEALTRWLNVNLKFDGTKPGGARLAWISYETARR